MSSVIYTGSVNKINFETIMVYLNICLLELIRTLGKF